MNYRTILLFCLMLFQVDVLQSQKSFTTEKPETVGMSSEQLREMNLEMHQLVDDGKLAGIQTAILRKRKLVHYDTYGFADIENKKPLQENSIYRIFSMTKPIVSVALMQLFEKGKFQLQDSVSKYIPEFRNMMVHSEEKGVIPAKKPMKIIDLLRHTSGIGYGRGENVHVNELYTEAQVTNSRNLEEFVTKLSKLPLYFEPGTNWAYGHSTDVCGYLVEVLSGKPLNQYLNEHILSPLKMLDTHFELPETKVDRFTTGYRTTENGQLVVAERPSESRFAQEVTLFLGGGGLVSTMPDYLRFCQMLLNKGELDGEIILKLETVNLMTRDHLEDVRIHQEEPLRLMPRETGFGLGFSVASYELNGDMGVYGWGGAVGTYFRIDPNQELAYILMIQLSPYRHLRLRERFPALVNNAITSSD